MLGSSIEILAGLFADRTIVRGDVEYFALCIYSFGVPVFLLFVLLNLILGIVGDAFGEEKENLGELSEPTLIEDFSMALVQVRALHGTPSELDALIQTLKAVRKSSSSKSVDVLASALGAKPDPALETPARGKRASARPRRVPSRRVRRRFRHARVSRVPSTFPEASARARARWASSATRASSPTSSSS